MFTNCHGLWKLENCTMMIEIINLIYYLVLIFLMLFLTFFLAKIIIKQFLKLNVFYGIPITMYRIMDIDNMSYVSWYMQTCNDLLYYIFSLYKTKNRFSKKNKKQRIDMICKFFCLSGIFIVFNTSSKKIETYINLLDKFPCT